jgi:hypothetical protein
MSVALGLMVAFVFGANLETRWLRVVTSAEAVNPVRLEDGRSRFLLLATKERLGCELVGLSWYAVYDDGTLGQVPVETARGGDLPPVGRFRDPLTVTIPPAASGHAGYYLFDCGMPWTTYALVGPFPNWFADAADP